MAGAVTLFDHDCIHIVLGRGLLPQDEAFVLGFTMGTSEACPAWQPSFFRFCARRLYQAPYRFSAEDSQVFDFAVRVARRTKAAALDRVNFRAWMSRPLREIRAELRVDGHALQSIYAAERARWPDGPASRRLP